VLGLYFPIRFRDDVGSAPPGARVQKAHRMGAEILAKRLRLNFATQRVLNTMGHSVQELQSRNLPFSGRARSTELPENCSVPAALTDDGMRYLCANLMLAVCTFQRDPEQN